MSLVIRSGGQDGSDLAGWRAATQCGLPCAGWMPAGFLTESGPKPHYATTYNARETRSREYQERTRLNVRDSDATIIFRSCRARSHRGCNLTARACGELKKPAMVIHVWSIPDNVPPTAKLAGLIRAKGFQVLNVAGTRASSDPGEPGRPWTGIEGWCFCYCLDLFTLLREQPS